MDVVTTVDEKRGEGEEGRNRELLRRAGVVVWTSFNEAFLFFISDRFPFFFVFLVFRYDFYFYGSISVFTDRFLSFRKTFLFFSARFP